MILANCNADAPSFTNTKETPHGQRTYPRAKTRDPGTSESSAGTSYVLTEEPNRLSRIINEMKYGSPPPQGNWAAFANAGKQARKTIYPAITAFQWAMFINAGCILYSGVVASAAFEIVRGAFQLAWAGVPRKNNGLKDLLAEAMEPPKLTLKTAGPLQREIIKSRYLNDDALVHRFFNASYPDAPFPLRTKLAESLTAIG